MFFNKPKKIDAKKAENINEKPKNENKNNKLTSKDIKNILGKNADFKFKEILINNNTSLKVHLFFIDGLVNQQYISDFILKPLNLENNIEKLNDIKDVAKLIDEGGIYYSSQQKETAIDKVLDALLTGSAAIVIDEISTAFLFEAKGFDKRNINEPTSENVTKGPKDAFVETIRVNTALVRRKIASKDLIIEQTTVGKQSKTAVSIVYMQNITNMQMVDEVKKRINSINIDAITSLGVIEEAVLDNINTVFPQMLSTERPDKFCADVVEGRVGIIIDGFPISLLIPGCFFELLQAPEDYSRQYIIGSLIRFLRFSLMILSLMLPAFYISVVSFHQEMIPSELALSIAESKINVPFPAFVETIMLLLAFEVLIEAGLRLPRNIGQAVSIVGALVVGDSAVNARLVSPTVVIVVAITVIATFAMPNQDFSNAIRLWRLFFSVLASFLGLVGLVIGDILLLIHLAKLESFGVCYLSPFAASKDISFEDTLFRLPFVFNKKRPSYLKPSNLKRQD